MRKFSLSALVAAGLLVGGLSVGSASAADLGGNCCADLEERIAELEATTARKGNRKVSLTISGWVAEQVMWWDDGVQRGTYVGGIGTTLASNVKFTGQATIMPGWYAGYVLHAEFDEHDPLLNNQQTGQVAAANLTGLGVFAPVQVLQSYWFIKSDHLGKVSVGQQSSAGDNAAILVDGSGSLVPANWVLFDNGGFFIRNQQGALTSVTWGGLGRCALSGQAIGGDCEAIPTNVVRYDSPVWSGFSMSADWGQQSNGFFFDRARNPGNDGGYWDIYGRYSGEYNGIKVAATTGWSHDNSIMSLQLVPNQLGLPAGQFRTDQVGYWQSGLYLEHVATGVWFLANYGQEFTETFPGFHNQPEHWYLKAGLREKWHPLGHSVVYGFYGQRDNMFDTGLVSGASGMFNTDCGSGECTVTGSRTTEWGGGFVQEIDAAAMSLWIQAEHFDATASACVAGVSETGACINNGEESGIIKSDLKGMSLVKFGGLINF
jgi:hypothetical protein